MLRSMYSGISGMKVNQTRLDVIGNNISNVSTTGFKSSRARFSDSLYQNVSDAMGPSQNLGGVNANQVGLGVQLASIDSVMSQGNLQPTGRALDVAIDGNGFFIVSSGPAVDGDGTIAVTHRNGNHGVTPQSLQSSGSKLMYSRDGSFVKDTDGSLLTGDGYRVMGYSLTNDDSTRDATAVASNTVTAGGFNFKFGPGSQLNGYKIVLGNIGPGTPTTCDVKGKEIIINGDFSATGSLTADQVQRAMETGLSVNGISQSVYVSGKPSSYPNLSSQTLSGGTDKTSPDTLSFAGYTIQFDEGAGLNGFKFEIADVTGPLNVQYNNDTTSPKLLVSGDFVNGDSFSIEDLTGQINSALEDAKLTQRVKSITGNTRAFSNLSAKSEAATLAVAPSFSGSRTSTTVPTTMLGFTVTVNSALKGEGLNGYSLTFNNTSGAPTTVINKTDKTIVISGDLSKIGDTATDLKSFNDDLHTQLTNKGIADASFDIGGDYLGTSAGTISSNAFFINGVNSKPQDPINVLGYTMSFPKPEDLGATTTQQTALDGIEFEVADINAPTLSVVPDTTNSKKFIIKGNFAKAGGVGKQELQDKINDVLKNTIPVPLIPGTIDGIKLSGNQTAYTGVTSAKISGGLDAKDPGIQTALGLQFTPYGGAALNGYTIKVGDVGPNTPTSVDISEKNHTITISGNFTTRGAVAISDIEDKLNEALQDSANLSSCSFSVKSTTSSMLNIADGVSLETNGGTPVQSIGEDGTIYFVDASQTVKSYDGSLKSLKIPDRVKLAGSEQEFAVKTFSIDDQGVIIAQLEGGKSAALGQIALANFKNPEGLTKMGGNLYSGSVNSGEAIIRSGVKTNGENNSEVFGGTVQKVLEMGNVDLAEQFTEMIISTRAFQASGKMISTGDEVLTEIINLKR